MKQVAQILRTGAIDAFDVPIPSLGDEFVLVRNEASLISAGTEKTKVDMGKKTLLQKARARPDLVMQVLQKIRTEGLRKTVRTVETRLDSLSAMGYSCAGIVVAVGGNVTGLRPGDRVACGGADYANHAEYVAVPKNLVVKVPDEVAFEEACFATVGSIALQGVRLAEPLLGETFLVVGLGLLGQLTVQLLRANGCTVIGTDLDSDLAKRAEEFGAIGVATNVQAVCRAHTRGYGVDGVLICAGSSSNSIIELAGEVTREKGRVVVVGAVRMDIPREPFFKKEITVVISRSYGPGRYDRLYEEDGHDYPYAYVRFSEQRNMETVVQLIAARQLDVKSLISHKFPVTEASGAYALIEGKKTEPYLGIVLLYPGSGAELMPSSVIVTGKPAPAGDTLRLSCYGAGGYATSSLLPVLVETPRVRLNGVVTASGRTAQAVAKRFGFAFCAGEYSELLGAETDVVLIASRHDTHADATCRALEAGKHVYVEKPLALSVEELVRIKATLQRHPAQQLMVGFNRRFAPLTREVLAHFSGLNEPRVVAIRVNAGFIPKQHWIQHPTIGGGRILGEACHFVDLASALVGALPKRVYAVAVGDAAKSALDSDNVCIAMDFADGSVANITYVASGSRAMRKEYVEVFGGGRSAAIDDFKTVTLFSGDRTTRRVSGRVQDKGQRSMLEQWVAGLQTGRPCVEQETLLAVSLATVLCVESLCVAAPMTVHSQVLDSSTSAEH